MTTQQIVAEPRKIKIQPHRLGKTRTLVDVAGLGHFGDQSVVILRAEPHHVVAKIDPEKGKFSDSKKTIRDSKEKEEPPLPAEQKDPY